MACLRNFVAQEGGLEAGKMACLGAGKTLRLSKLVQAQERWRA